MESVVGRIGTLSIAVASAETPGEALVEHLGGSQAFLAFADAPIARGATVLVVGEGRRGPLSVDVVEWIDSPQ